MKINLAQIREDTALQPREHMKTDLVAEYAERMTEGDIFPPVVVFRAHDGGVSYLADGYHRVAAARQAGMTEIESDVRQGSKRDAILFSVGANANHGERRTNADKRRAVMTLLEDDEWSKWSDNDIARRCSVSPDTVNRTRRSLSESDSDAPQQRTYTTKHGTTATMNIENIGRKPQQPEPKSTRGFAFDYGTDIGDEDLDPPDIGQAFVYTDVDEVANSIMEYVDLIFVETDAQIHHAVLVNVLKQISGRARECEVKSAAGMS